MDMNNVNIEEIVKQVLSGMTGNAPAAASAPAASTGIPKTARVAVLTEKEHLISKNTRSRQSEMTISWLKLKDVVYAVQMHTNSREIHLT